MFFITNTLLNKFKHNPDGFKSFIEDNFALKESANKDMLDIPYSHVEKKGAVLNFIHVSD